MLNDSISVLSALQINKCNPPTLTLPHKWGGDQKDCDRNGDIRDGVHYLVPPHLWERLGGGV